MNSLSHCLITVVMGMSLLATESVFAKLIVVTLDVSVNARYLATGQICRSSLRMDILLGSSLTIDRIKHCHRSW
jgi:hypothetical protein